MNKLLGAIAALALLALPSVAPAQGVTVQGLNPASSPLSSSDVFWCGQGTHTYKCSLSQIAGYPVSIANIWSGGKQTFAPSTTGYASINLASGGTPSGPLAGDMWCTSASCFIQTPTGGVNLGTVSASVAAGSGINVGVAGSVYTVSLAATQPTAGAATGVVGLTAVNGVASTFLRSDGSPSLSVAISPTWTGAHVFNGTFATNNNSAVFNAGINVAGGTPVFATAPTFNGAGTPTFTTPANWRTALGLGTASTLTSGVATGNLAPVATGTVLQVLSGTTTGTTSTSTTPVGMVGSGISVTPKSTNSTLFVEVYFGGEEANFAATYTQATFQIFEGTCCGALRGAGYYMSALPSNAGVYMPAVVAASLTNAALTARTFGLSGLTSSASAAVTTYSVVYKVTEIQN
jgi:hypothetical protein